MMDGSSVMTEEESLKKHRRSVQSSPASVSGQIISRCVTDTQSLTNVAANSRSAGSNLEQDQAHTGGTLLLMDRWVKGRRRRDRGGRGQKERKNKHIHHRCTGKQSECHK